MNSQKKKYKPRPKSQAYFDNNKNQYYTKGSQPSHFEKKKKPFQKKKETVFEMEHKSQETNQNGSIFDLFNSGINEFILLEIEPTEIHEENEIEIHEENEIEIHEENEPSLPFIQEESVHQKYIYVCDICIILNK